MYNVVSAYVCFDYDGVPKEDGDEVQELRFFGYADIPIELSPPDKPVIDQFLKKTERNSI
ncbi:hypothetical protein D3C78_1854540 [compost metagenome]